MQTNTFFKTLSAAALALILAACGGQKDSTPAASAASPAADNGGAERLDLNSLHLSEQTGVSLCVSCWWKTTRTSATVLPPG